MWLQVASSGVGVIERANGRTNQHSTLYLEEYNNLTCIIALSSNELLVRYALRNLFLLLHAVETIRL